MTHPAPAPVGRRALAWLLDTVALGVCGSVLLVIEIPRALARVQADAAPIAPPSPGLVVLAWLLLVAFGLVQWWTLGTRGWTVGRLLVGLRVVDVRSGRPVGMGRAIMRALVVTAGTLVCGVGQLVVLTSPLFDPQGRNRGWHDKAARAEVVDLRTGSLPPARARRAPAAQERAGVQVIVGHGAADHDGGRQGSGSAEPATHDVVQRRLSALLTDRRTGSPRLELAPFPAPGVSPDVDTRTMPILRPVNRPLDPGVEETRRAPWGAAERRAAGPAVDPATAELELNDGRLVTIADTAFVGRNPTGGEDVQLVRIVDPGRSVSKTHLQIGVDGRTVWVADRGSTNGTLVTLHDGQQIVCVAGERVRIPLGATVSFGDCSLTVVRTPETA